MNTTEPQTFRGILANMSATSVPAASSGRLTYADITRLLGNIYESGRAMPDTNQPDPWHDRGDPITGRLTPAHIRALEEEAFASTTTSAPAIRVLDPGRLLSSGSGTLTAPREFPYPFGYPADPQALARHRIAELEREVVQLNEQLEGEQQEKANLHGMLARYGIDTAKLLHLLQRVPHPENWEDGTLLEAIVATLDDYRRRGVLTTPAAHDE